MSNNWNNKLYCGDNLEILSTLEKDSVDLIYIDPPFFSNRNYEIIWGDEAEIRSFDDRWDGGINVYIDWMKHRVIELHRVLKSTGSFYLHCDWHASHYLKVLCDSIFGYENFLNEIIWKRTFNTGSSKASAKRFPTSTDTIFSYAKSKNFTFNPQTRPFSEGAIKRYDKIDKKGKFMWVPLKTVSKKRLMKLRETGEIREEPHLKYPRYKKYFDVDKGSIADNLWIDIPHMSTRGGERLGYPTQKPEALLERIIKATSNENDIVLDAFCGCGTALAVAEKFNRKWIGIDISPSAIALIKTRLSAIPGFIANYDVIGMPQKVEDLKDFKPYEFQYWVINEMHGTPSPRKSGDMGIDGLSFLEHCPIQVKQSKSIGRNVIDNFETALRRYYGDSANVKKGYVVAFSFGRGAKEEVARAKKDNINIILITAEDILNKTFSLNQ